MVKIFCIIVMIILAFLLASKYDKIKSEITGKYTSSYSGSPLSDMFNFGLRAGVIFIIELILYILIF